MDEREASTTEYEATVALHDAGGHVRVVARGRLTATSAQVRSGSARLPFGLIDERLSLRPRGPAQLGLGGASCALLLAVCCSAVCAAARHVGRLGRDVVRRALTTPGATWVGVFCCCRLASRARGP